MKNGKSTEHDGQSPQHSSLSAGEEQLQARIYAPRTEWPMAGTMHDRGAMRFMMSKNIPQRLLVAG